MEDYYWFVLDIKNNKVVNAFEEEYKEDAKEYIEMETEGDKEYRKNFKIISKRTKEKLGYEYPATTKKDAKGGEREKVKKAKEFLRVQGFEFQNVDDKGILETAKELGYKYDDKKQEWTFGDDMIEIFPLDKNGDNIKLL